MGELTTKVNNVAEDSQQKPAYIVGIGASAGGLKSLQQFFSNMQADSGIAFVIIQHLSPDYKSMMAELLAKNTEMPICRAEDNTVMMANHIYLITPRKNITTMRGRLFLAEQPERHGLNLPIDIFFRSLAEDQGERGIGIILSGTGSDGTRGLRAIKAEGGTIFVQDEDSAEFDGMPRCAIATGLADFILPPQQMPAKLLKFINHPRISVPTEPMEVMTKEEDSFAKLFYLLKEHCKVDFTFYKPATVIRRIERRMGLVQTPGIDDYLVYIRDNQKEIKLLFKDLLIGVTKFFRDREAFDALSKKAIPAVVEAAAKKNTGQLRIWDIGCSTGEEAYSIALLVQDCLDQKDIDLDVKIFATDIDQQALDFAYPGTYPESIAADVPVKYLSKYFEKIPDGYRIRKSLRKMVIFAVHNIINDPPFTKIDLIVCRNMLIYFQAVLQKKIFHTINYILQKDGYLFLGNSETLVAVEDAFETIDSKHRLFKHKFPGTMQPPFLATRSLSKDSRLSAPRINYENMPEPRSAITFSQEKYYQGLLNKVVDTVLVVNEMRELVQSFGNTARFLKVPTGNSSLDILSMLPKDTALVISSAMQKVRKEKKPITCSNITTQIGEESVHFNLLVDQLTDKKENENKLFVIHIRETEDLRSSAQTMVPQAVEYLADQRIEDLEKEVQFTRENLQTTIEELQATNEELLAANEELQSTNEELQSVNEELNTVNAEYQNKVLELTELNTDMDNLMTSSDIPTIFLDRNLCIRKFTTAITRDINLLAQDIGRPITDLNIPMFGNLKKDTAKVVKEGKRVTKTIRHKDEWFLQRILPFVNDSNMVDGVVLTMLRITDQKNAEFAWEMQHNLLLSILEGSPAAIIMTDKEGWINFINRPAENILGIERSRLLRMKINSKKFNITDIDDNRISPEDEPLSIILSTEKPLINYIMCIRRPDNKSLILSLNANPTFNSKKQVDGAVFEIHPVAYADDDK
jgi:two-component system CheB/CheR fusion protein